MASLPPRPRTSTPHQGRGSAGLPRVALLATRAATPPLPAMGARSPMTPNDADTAHQFRLVENYRPPSALQLPSQTVQQRIAELPAPLPISRGASVRGMDVGRGTVIPLQQTQPSLKRQASKNRLGFQIQSDDVLSVNSEEQRVNSPAVVTSAVPNSIPPRFLVRQRKVEKPTVSHLPFGDAPPPAAAMDRSQCESRASPARSIMGRSMSASPAHRSTFALAPRETGEESMTFSRWRPPSSTASGEPDELDAGEFALQQLDMFDHRHEDLIDAQEEASKQRFELELRGGNRRSVQVHAMTLKQKAAQRRGSLTVATTKDFAPPKIVKIMFRFSTIRNLSVVQKLRHLDFAVLQEQFLRAARNGNLGKSQYMTVMVKYIASHERQEAMRVFEAFERNALGEVDASMFLVGLQMLLGCATPSDAMRYCFSMLDANSSIPRYITRYEIQTLIDYTGVNSNDEEHMALTDAINALLADQTLYDYMGRMSLQDFFDFVSKKMNEPKGTGRKASGVRNLATWKMVTRPSLVKVTSRSMLVASLRRQSAPKSAFKQ